MDNLEGEIPKIIEDSNSAIQKLEINCLFLFYFWSKQEYLEDVESIFDVLDYL